MTLAGSSLALHPGAVPRVEVVQLESVRYDANMPVQVREERKGRDSADGGLPLMPASPVADRELSFPCVQSCNPLRSAVRYSYSTGLLLSHWFPDLLPDVLQHADLRCV